MLPLAEFHVLLEGSLEPTVSTCSLTVDVEARVVIDPRPSPSQTAADVPRDDPHSPDLSALRASRARILGLAAIIVPGRGAPFQPSSTTPR